MIKGERIFPISLHWSKATLLPRDHNFHLLPIQLATRGWCKDSETLIWLKVGFLMADKLSGDHESTDTNADMGRTIHRINFASSLDCSTPLWVFRKVFFLLAFLILSFLSTLCSSQEPSSLCTCQTKVYLAKHAHLLCLPAKEFT